LRIFRIDDANLGQYSPVIARHATTAADAVALLAAADFDPKRDVIVEGDVPTGLVPATAASITVDRGPKLIVQATSQGDSLLVLPFDYSHCLRIKNTRGGAELVPVNLHQTGLLFKASVEAEVTYRFGLFDESECRRDDLNRADRLQLKEALVRSGRATLTNKRSLSWEAF
jgi:hypothetical protein